MRDKYPEAGFSKRQPTILPLPRQWERAGVREIRQPQICAQVPSANPEGIASFSLGLPDSERDYPRYRHSKLGNPERVEYQRLVKWIQPFQGWEFSGLSPRVARSSQPLG